MTVLIDLDLSIAICKRDHIDRRRLCKQLDFHMQHFETPEEFIRGRLENAYASHYGWDIDIMHGRKLIRNNHEVRHKIDGPLPAMMVKDRPIHRLLMYPFGRFGNRVIQIKNAAFIAEQSGANILQIADVAELFRPILQDGYMINPSLELCPLHDEIVMQGSFYYAASLNIQMDSNDHIRQIRKVIRPLLLPRATAFDDRVGPDDLVMHFRAGDIMTGPHIHDAYGQPPASFYLKVAAQSGATRFWLVYEDESNPAIAIVHDKLQQMGKTVLRQSSTLLEDCRLILSARHFAAGCGSFGIALAEISTRLRHFYSFYEFELNPLSALKKSPVEAVRIEDRDGLYKNKCLSNNWKASSEQLQLLKSYPVENLMVNPTP